MLNIVLKQWNAHFFLLTSTKLYYTDETNLISQNYAGDEDDEDKEEEEDNATNSQMEVGYQIYIETRAYYLPFKNMALPFAAWVTNSWTMQYVKYDVIAQTLLSR